MLKLTVTLKIALVLAAGLAGALAHGQQNGSERLFRYYNEHGVLVIDYTIPPQYVENGYEIVSRQGHILEKVPPRSEALTPEEIAAREEQKKEDAFIRRSYSTPADIERARERRLDLVRREIDILKSNLVEFSRRRVEVREQAASYQASGQQTPESVAQLLEDLDSQEDNTLRLLAERKSQISEVNRRFDRYQERLLILRPGLRPEEAAVSEETGAR